MPTQLAFLATVLRENKAAVVAHWEAAVGQLPSAAFLSGPALWDHIPRFVDEMIAAIARRSEEVAEGGLGSPIEHGMQRFADGFDIREVVIEYNILRDAALAVAEAAGVRLHAADCQVINHIIDDASASAVTTFVREQAAEIQRRREEHFAFVAHDVRTPLNAIALTAMVFAEDLRPDDHETADMLRVLQRNVQRIAELIQRFMEAEQHREEGNGLRLIRREIDLWPLVYRLFQDLRPVTDAAQIRSVNLVPRHLTLHADAALLTRALQNLVGNSVKFAPAGEIEIGAKETEHGAECWVKDTGAGISPERIGRIFDKLETDPDPTRAGAGLGLAICKQIIEAHGGTINVESQLGTGTTFKFTIPLPKKA